MSSTLNAATSGGLTMTSDTSGILKLQTAGTDAVTITAAQNVGVGTTTPYAKLQATGTIKVATGNAQGILALGEANGTTVNCGIWRGAANAPTSDGNYLNFGGYEGLVFATGNAAIGSQTARMRIDSSGNVGINNTSPSTFGKFVMQINGTTTPTNATNIGPASLNLYAAGYGGSTDCTTGVFGWMNGTPGIGAGIGFSRQNSADWGSQIRFYTHPTDTSNIGDITERARIDASGNLLVGTTTATPAGITAHKLVVERTSVIYAAAFGYSADNLPRTQVTLFNSNGAVGVISTSGSATTYATSSDYRLKENIAPMTGALSVVQQLNPVTYNWKVDGSEGQGFIAHELQAVVPDAVVGAKDATEIQQYEITPAVLATYDEEGNELTPAVDAVTGEREVPVYQGIDTSFLVATLTAAIKEMKEIIDQQSERITALEGATQ